MKLLAGAIGLLMMAAACSGVSSFSGTVLISEPAPAFELQDQFGRLTALSDLRGKVVALSFLYTGCPDVCPLTTATLRNALDQMGEDAHLVELVAISVDPERDSVERARRYSEDMGMLDRWRFLVGSEEELKPIWRSYWLDPVTIPLQREEDIHQGSEEGDHAHGGVTLAYRSPADEYLISHTAPVFLIDREGQRRVLFSSLTLDPGPLVHDLRLLLK